MATRPGLDEPAREPEARLLQILERLLEIDASTVSEALNAAAQLVGEALGAEKVDAYLYQPDNQTLQVAGLSDTPMSRKQVAIGMDRLALADGGRIVEVFQTGTTYLTGHADQDPAVRPGFTEGLGVRSILVAPLEVGGERRGVVQAASAREEAFSASDGAFFAAVTNWVGLAQHRAELAEQHLQAAAEQGRRAAAEELVTMLAHDLHNLLTPLDLRLRLLRRRFAHEQRTADSDEIQRLLDGMARLNGLIVNLLDTARLEQGAFELTLQECDVAALTQNTVALLSTAATPIAVRADHPIIVRADPERLRQAIENLLSNALEHSPQPGSVSLSVDVELHGAGQWARLVVQDQGPGISPELLPQLFERYVKGAHSSGIGFGLYAAYQIARAHGGSLTAESSPGQGARFTLRLPLQPRKAHEGVAAPS